MRFWLAICGIIAATSAQAEVLVLSPRDVVEWKAVYGQVETRNRVPARARIGGTIVELDVAEGDRVEAGDRVALVEDDKLEFRLEALDGRRQALAAQLETAESELERARTLFERGVITSQRLDQLQTSVDVTSAEIRSLDSERLIIEQQVDEGAVLAPEDGVVLSVPISRGSVVTPGEALAVIGGGGVYLRLAVPERHAGDLAEGDLIELGTGADGDRSGKLVKLYPQIEGGRVQADVEVEGLDPNFVGRRIPVRLPVGERSVLMVPEAAIEQVGGLDFVRVETPEGETLRRSVVPGRPVRSNGEEWREILSGLAAGDRVVIGDE